MTSKIEQQVMASVGVIYTARKLVSRTAAEIYVLAVSAVVLWQLVWVHKVFDNFFAVEKKGIGSTLNYLATAVGHTNPAVQLTLVVAVVAFVMLVSDLAKSSSLQNRQIA
jgi:hypothetical protein